MEPMMWKSCVEVFKIYLIQISTYIIYLFIYL